MPDSQEDFSGHFIAAGWTVFAGEKVSPSESGMDLWLAPSDVDKDLIRVCRDLLSGDDIQRAERVLIEKKRNERLLSRAFLRQVLGLYLECPATEIRFGRGEAGKPFLTAPSCEKPLQFNLSHSGGAILLGISTQSEIGVDIEKRRCVERRDRIAMRFLAAQEIAWLNSCAEEERTEIFFKIWTRKEAIMKAVGLGLHLSLESFSVASEGKSGKLELNEPEECRGPVFFRDISCGPAYAVAVASLQAQEIGRQRIWNWKNGL